MALDRRRQFILAVPFQVRFIAFRFILLVIVALGLWILVFYPLQLQTIVDILDTSRTMPESSLPVPSARVLLGIVAIFALMAAMAIFESHRIAGPISQFEKTLKALIAGESPPQLNLRRSDNFTHLVPVINEVAARHESATRAERLVRETLAPQLDELEAVCCQDNVPEQVRSRVEELRTWVRQAL